MTFPLSRKRAYRSMTRAGLLITAVWSSACSTGTQQQASSTELASLKTVFEKSFMVGAALNTEQFEERDVAGAQLTKSQFNTISPENVLKWENVHPTLGTYNFAPADRYVDFGTRNKMFVVGHTLVWHSQVPRWVFQDANGQPLGRDSLLSRMRDHIRTVVTRYKGRINGWDVVNEALEEDGSLRKSPWLNIIGEDFIAKAFQYAHEADPNAELYYNDYSLENPAKRAGAIRLIKSLQAQGIVVKAIGMQGHMKMDWPSVGLEDSTITMFAALGVKIHITELDVDVLPRATQGTSADVSQRAGASASLNPYAAGLPDSVSQALAKRYADLFSVYQRHAAVIDRVTFWGVADGDSWLNNWPVRGRTNYPLLFDRQHQAKAAFHAIIAAAKAAPRQ